jgi:hypothetical protein
VLYGVVVVVAVIVLHIVVVTVITPCGIVTVVAVIMPRDWSVKEGVSRRKKKRIFKQMVACEVKLSPSLLCADIILPIISYFFFLFLFLD